MSNIKKIQNFKEIKKVLVIQFKPFGDVFLTSALFEPIKTKLPYIELSLLVFHPFQLPVVGHPFLDNIIVYKRKNGIIDFINRVRLYRKLQKQKFDLVIDLQNDPGSQQATFFSFAKYRIGYKHGQFSFFYNYKSIEGKPRYAASRRFDILQPLGIVEESWRLYYTITESSKLYIDRWLQSIGLIRSNFIIISPGSPVASKKWESQCYSDLADIIIEKLGLSVILLWAKSELVDCEKIQKTMRNNAVIAIPTDLNQAAALLKNTKLLICNDGGLNHISCATETKTIAIFGHTSPLDWSPSSVFSHHHHIYNNACKDKKDTTFGITIDEVFAKILEIL